MSLVQESRQCCAAGVHAVQITFEQSAVFGLGTVRGHHHLEIEAGPATRRIADEDWHRRVRILGSSGHGVYSIR